MNQRPIVTEKMLGCLYGQAIGDALGLGSEFMSKSKVADSYPDGLFRYEQIIQDNHRSRWKKGAWTDDTDMMLCIMDSFDDGRFDTHRIAKNFKNWCDSDPMGIGSHTLKVLSMADYVDSPKEASKLWWELSRRQGAANGALMRTSVVGLAKDDVAIQAETICKLTHYDPRCIGACVICSEIIYNLVWNNRELSYGDIIALSERYDARIIEWVELAFKSGDISALELDEPYTMGYTLRTLAAALWCYSHSADFTSGLLAVVNEGGDADTNAAVACAVLGAKFGIYNIPPYYVDNLFNEPLYQQKVTSFIEKALA